MLNARAAMTQAHLKIPSGPRSAPAHATLRVEVLEPDGYLKRSSWLLGEAHWADEFTPPSFGSLARWTALAGPVAIAHFFGTRCRRSRRTAIAHLPYLFLVSSLVGLAETLLLVVLVLGLLPVDRLRGLAYKIQRTLTGVLGDAYVFTTDDLQRQAIMDRVSRDLNWMLGRCRAVIVVAHSQGAAVATRVLQRDREGRRADSVLTFGSGLRPLHAVEEGIRSAAVARGGWTALFAVTAVWLGVSLWWFSGSDLGPSLSALGLLLLVWIGSAVGSGIPPETTPPLGPWSGHDDVYSAADPVPGGPLVDEERLKFPGFQSKEIRNGGSVLTDHNLYWRNAEEFVSLVVRRAAEAAHLEPLVRSMDGAENHLAAAAARRRFRVRLLSASRWLAAGSTAACLALGWDALVTVFGWAWSALASTLAGDGWSVRELPARDVFFRFVMPAVPLTLYSGVTGPAWHSWGGSEFRSMTARIGARRSAWSIVFSLATLAGIMPVLWLLWPQGWLAALVSLAATSIAVALAIPRPTLAWRTNGT